MAIWYTLHQQVYTLLLVKHKPISACVYTDDKKKFKNEIL